MKPVVKVKFISVLILIFLGIAVLAFTERTIGAGQRFMFKAQTVEDLKTRLFWTRDANPADCQMNWYDAVEYVKNLNQQKFGGYSDWRLPDVEEMHKLATAVQQVTGAKAPAGDMKIASVLETTGFRNVQAADYWTSTTSLFVETEAWYYNLASGSRAMGSKWLYSYVWPVRWQR